MPYIVPEGRDWKIYIHWLKSKSLAKTGAKFGLTRGRISQIIKREKVIPKR